MRYEMKNYANNTAWRCVGSMDRPGTIRNCIKGYQVLNLNSQTN